MYDIKLLWKELKMEYEQEFKLTDKQNSIINFCLKTSASSSGVLAPLPTDDAVEGRWKRTELNSL